MNAATAKANFGKINMAALPAELKNEFVEIKKETSDFTATGTEANVFYNNFADLYSIVEGGFPNAINGKTSKKSKAKPAAQKAIKAKGNKAKGTKAKAAKRKDGMLAVSSKSKSAVSSKSKSAVSSKSKTVAAPKAPRVKAPAKPKVTRKVAAKMTPAEKAMKAKRAKFDKMKTQLKAYKEILKDNDKVKMEIARDAQRQYNKIVQLGKSSFDVAYDKLEIEYNLYHEFVLSDRRSLLSIRKKAVGKVEPSLGKAKTAAKKKKATKKKAQKPEPKGFFGRLFS
jgi:vacuolar-type H+-ATPase subunit I/STV1